MMTNMPPWMMPLRRTAVARERWSAAIAYAKNRAKVTIIVKYWNDMSAVKFGDDAIRVRSAKKSQRFCCRST